MDGARWNQGTLLKLVVAVIAASGFALTLLAKRVEDSTGTACADRMRQIVQAFRLYMVDHDDRLPEVDWESYEFKPYLQGKSKRDLLCPKARFTQYDGFSTYTDVPQYYRLNIRGKTFDPHLPAGWTALPFDPHRDALLKCEKHGARPVTISRPGMMPGTSRTFFTYFQTAYLDGHVRFAPRQMCWDLAWRSRKIYERSPYLIPQCDGRLERTATKTIVELPASTTSGE